MSPISKTVALTAAVVVLIATPAFAQSRYTHPHYHHHARYAPAQPNGDGEPYGYRNAPYPQAYGGYYGTGERRYGAEYGRVSGFGYAGGWEAAANARLTAQAYREPGLTLELAPDSKQTATGGPSGGVPGFSGH